MHPSAVTSSGNRDEVWIRVAVGTATPVNRQVGFAVTGVGIIGVGPECGDLLGAEGGDRVLSLIDWARRRCHQQGQQRDENKEGEKDSGRSC